MKVRRSGHLIAVLQVVGDNHIYFGHKTFDGRNELPLPECSGVYQLKSSVQERRGDDEIDEFAPVSYLLRGAAYLDTCRVYGYLAEVAVVVAVLEKTFAYLRFTDIPTHPG